VLSRSREVALFALLADGSLARISAVVKYFSTLDDQGDLVYFKEVVEHFCPMTAFAKS